MPNALQWMNNTAANLGAQKSAEFDAWAKENPQAAAAKQSQQGENWWNSFWGDVTGRHAKEMQSAMQADAKNRSTFAREDSAIQRQMADAQAAGLNPTLMQNAGSGAAVGNYASGEPAPSSGAGQAIVGTLGAIVSAVASKAIGAKMLASAMEKKTAAQAASDIARNAAKSYTEIRRKSKAGYIIQRIVGGR